MTYEVHVIADSISIAGVRLTTLECTFPRFILAEFNTHRALSRNSASSRAIPIRKRIDQVLQDPFVPEQWGQNQRGMQASKSLREQDALDARARWLTARLDAVNHAMFLDTLGVHKQLANRLLEPFLWHTCVVTATDWSNFFHLRCHPDAQPEFQRIACMMRDIMQVSVPTPMPMYGWHLPYVDPSTDNVASVSADDLPYISAARCARLSYLHNGSRDPAADLKLSQKLERGGHMSPFEHPAKALADPSARHGNFCGWMQLRKTIPYEHDPLGEGARNGNL